MIRVHYPTIIIIIIISEISECDTLADRLFVSDHLPEILDDLDFHTV